MGAQLLSQFTNTHRRSAIRGSDELLSGRWAAIDANGQAVLPGAGSKIGLYWLLEGNRQHIGSPTDFGGSPFPSTNFVELPAVQASNAVALVYGDFRAEVGPEGVDPAAAYNVRDELEVDNFGRLVPLAAGVTAAVVEAVTTDVGGNVTSLTFRSVAQ